MASLQNAPSVHLRWCASTQVDFAPRLGQYNHGHIRRGVSFLVEPSNFQFLPYILFKLKADSFEVSDGTNRRQLLAMGAALAPWVLLSDKNYTSFAIENKKGFQAVLDQKDQYQFLYPFGWQEVVIEGQDKVYKDVIEPLESVSVNLIATNKQDIRDLGPPKDVAEALIKKVLAPPSQRTKLLDATEHDVDGTAYYTFEFVAKAPNYTRHALSTICIANGKFYTLTTGSNERRWEKMKDKLHTVVDSFKIGTL